MRSVVNRFPITSLPGRSPEVPSAAGTMGEDLSDTPKWRAVRRQGPLILALCANNGETSTRLKFSLEGVEESSRGYS